MSSVHETNHPQNLVLYFQVHQPKRLRTLRFFDIGSHKSYEDEALNREIIARVATKCYIPTNQLLYKLIQKNPRIKVAFSISGVTIDQLEVHAPEALESFRQLTATGSVEFLAETYHHSLACMMDSDEMETQILKHQEKIWECFGVRPQVFRNTELIYNDTIGKRINMLGFNGIITDGVEKVLQGRTPHQLYHHPEFRQLTILTRDYHLSDDIAFRFSQPQGKLTADQYMQWLEATPAHEQLITLAMDYETFGEHQKKEAGILTFLENILTNIANSNRFRMMTPGEAIESLAAQNALPVTQCISWADREKDISAWLGNEIQRDAFDSLVKLENTIKKIGDSSLLEIWRTMMTSDHFYYMSTKKGSDGEVHNYFSPYASPYEAFINYMNVLTDFTLQVNLRKQAIQLPVAEEEKWLLMQEQFVA